MFYRFNDYQLRKYAEYPYVPPIDPLHPSHDDEVNMLGKVKTVNIIIRGLPGNVLNHMKNFECAYISWKDLEKRYPDYSMKNLDTIFHKSIAFVGTLTYKS